MRTPYWSWLMALGLAVSFGCSQPQEPDAGSTTEQTGSEEKKSEVDIALDALDEAWDDIEDDEEKVALARGFLEEYPGSQYTGDVLGAVLHPLVDELGREQEAYAIFEEAMAPITDSEVKLDAQKQLAVLHSKAGRLDDLSALAMAMAEEHEFKYTDYLDLMETGTEAEAWELVIQQADASMALATPEAFLAQYDDIDEEDAQKWGRRREAYSAAHKGWAQENLGMHAAALTTFSENADKTTFSFLGADDTPLHLNWGKTLIRQEEPAEALKVLEFESLYGSDDAKKAYEEAWIATREDIEGLEEHLWSIRQQNAKPLPQFALANYDGQQINTADFANHVILIVSWSPT